MGDPRAEHDVGPRGRRASRRPARRRPHRRRHRARGRRRPADRVEAGVRRATRRRDHGDTPIQMATVRPGVLPLLEPRATATRRRWRRCAAERSGRVRTLGSGRDDDVDAPRRGTGRRQRRRWRRPRQLRRARSLLAAIGGTLAATRKVTDNGWLPRSRQVGITGRSIQPALYIAIGVSGKFNHTVGLRAAGTVLAINADAAAPIFDVADIGIVGDWTEIVPLLTGGPHRPHGDGRADGSATARSDGDGRGAEDGSAGVRQAASPLSAGRQCFAASSGRRAQLDGARPGRSSPRTSGACGGRGGCPGRRSRARGRSPRPPA